MKSLLICAAAAITLSSCTFYGIMKPTPLPIASNYSRHLTKVAFYEQGDTVLFKAGGFFVEAKVVDFYNLLMAQVKIKNGQNCKIHTSQIKYSKSKTRDGLKLGQRITFKRPELFTSVLETGNLVGVAPNYLLVRVLGDQVEVPNEYVVK